LTQAVQSEPQHAPAHAALATAWAALGYQQRSRQEALIARDLSKGLSLTQQLEYEGLADESESDWPSAMDTYGTLLQLHPDNIGYDLNSPRSSRSTHFCTPSNPRTRTNRRQPDISPKWEMRWMTSCESCAIADAPEARALKAGH
jgi:hypothetical protein